MMPLDWLSFEHLTTLAGIQLRTGGMSNTGVLASVGGLDDDELGELYEGGRVCGDVVRLCLFFSFRCGWS